MAAAEHEEEARLGDQDGMKIGKRSSRPPARGRDEELAGQAEMIAVPRS